MRFGKWESVKDNSLPDPTATILATAQEKTMPDAKSTTTKKVVEKKTPSYCQYFKKICRGHYYYKAYLRLWCQLDG